jgi:hypothetical protein
MRQRLRQFTNGVRRYLSAPTTDAVKGLAGQIPRLPDAGTQIQLSLTYRHLAATGQPLPRFADIGFKCYSQSDEDGILLYLFALIGTTKKLAVEICAGDGIECNTANLILNHGWHGLLVDGNAAAVETGRSFYARSPHTYVYPPKFVHEWITRDCVNRLVTDAGFAGDIDLLSLDIDGVDYWIWEALAAVQPRVVVVEYQDILGPDRAWTVPYTDDFDAWRYPTTDGMPNFCGAGLAAFVKLAKRKNYRLVGTNRYEYNAFFVRDGLGNGILPEVPATACFTHPKAQWGMRERFPTVKDLPWVEV